MHNRETAHILIVEDNPEDAELMLRALNKRRLSDDVFIAANGAQALDFVYCRGGGFGMATNDSRPGGKGADIAAGIQDSSG